MKTILFPTDFSKCAENALGYATELCKVFNAKLILYNSFHIPVFTSITPTDIEEQLVGITSDDLFKLKKQLLASHKDLEIECIVNAGLASDNIISIANEKQADLIVMGTKGASGLADVLIGTNATAVLEKAPCPVMVIPENLKFKSIAKIAFATNYNDSDIQTIATLTQIASLYNSEILIVHISEYRQTDDYENEMQNWLDNEVRIKGNITYPNISVHNLIGGNVDWELENYIIKNNIDILSMSMRKRNSFSKLFSSSLTKKMAYHAHTPLLVFHAA